jgi:rSAM/selenodomain-associated transferase 1
MGMVSCVLMLVKYPEKGKVKVRLTRRIDDDLVVRIYRNFVLDSLSVLKRSGIPFIVCFHPADSLDRFEGWLGTQYDYMPQRGRDLGERLRNGLADVIERGYKSAMAIGSDTPDLPEDILLQGRTALETHDVVIGPSPDGGYYLIGFRRSAFLPEAFEGIKWSADTVYLKTVRKLEAAGRSIHVLPVWWDIDTFDDLVALDRGNRNPNFASSETMQFLRRHGEIIFQRTLER